MNILKVKFLDGNIEEFYNIDAVYTEGRNIVFIENGNGCFQNVINIDAIDYAFVDTKDEQC